MPTRYTPRQKFSKRKLRSAISHGKAILANVDHRSAPMLRLQDLEDLFANDLGGPDNMSFKEEIVANNLAMLELLAELDKQQIMAGLNKGKSPSAEVRQSFERITKNIRQQAEALGLQRRAKDITPSLSTYLREQAEAAE